ncbi:MAG: glutamate-1-semialdehyde-2,1-aminomutase [Deltaproteobacteria bacterium]|nr:MAG: glutamate-1-semialdehyde-2,1-aminomutase [Deltaproteobacteria bacterium]
MKLDQSIALMAQAKKIIPAGVNSPVRAYLSVGGNPPFIREAHGSKITDVDGNTYIDYVASWGPMILGHAHPRVIEAIKKTAERGTSYGAPTPLEVEMAEEIVSTVPSLEWVRMVNSGTEATMSALRLARGFTGRSKIVKFEGCYHGHVDSLLVKAGSGGMTFGTPDSAGVPEGLARETLIARYNDLSSVEALFSQYPGEIAAVIVEPVAGNMGMIPPKEGFLEGLRGLTRKEGALLIFDEVITGFRVGLTGAQGRFGIDPDMTCLGKIIGGGLPVGAFGGKAEIMEAIAPLGPVYQAGTLSGNPLAVSAGLTTLKILKEEGVYEQLEEKGGYLAEGVQKAFSDAGIPVQSHRIGSMFCNFFTETPVVDYGTAKTSDTERFGKFFTGLLGEGIYIAPSQFETGFVSLSHTKEDLDRTIEAVTKVARGL